MRSAAALLPPLLMKSSTRLRKSVEYAIIINSNINLKKCKLIFGIHYKTGTFRSDLYERLKPLHIFMPPLRQRRVDIPALVEHFLGKNKQFQSQKRGSISPQALALLQGYDWPGNIRELKGVLTRACLFAKGELILPQHLPAEL